MSRTLRAGDAYLASLGRLAIVPATGRIISPAPPNTPPESVDTI